MALIGTARPTTRVDREKPRPWLAWAEALKLFATLFPSISMIAKTCAVVEPAEPLLSEIVAVGPE